MLERCVKSFLVRKRPNRNFPMNEIPICVEVTVSWSEVLLAGYISRCLPGTCCLTGIQTPFEITTSSIFLLSFPPSNFSSSSMLSVLRTKIIAMYASLRQDRQSTCTSHFFTLPLELRQRILKYVFADQVVPLPCHIPRCGKTLICENISVLLACRQMLEDGRHLILPAVVGRIFISVPSGHTSGPFIQMPSEERLQYLTRLNSWVGGDVLPRLRRLVMNLDDAPVVLAPFLELEQIRLGNESEWNWRNLDIDRSDEIPTMRSKRLTVIMPELEEVTILTTTSFIENCLLPEGMAHRFQTGMTCLPDNDSSLLLHPRHCEFKLSIGESFHCPIRASFCHIPRGRHPTSQMSSTLRYEKLALLSCIEQKEWFDDDVRRRVAISVEARNNNYNVVQAMLHEDLTMDVAIIEQSHAVGRQKDYKSDGMGMYSSSIRAKPVRLFGHPQTHHNFFS